MLHLQYNTEEVFMHILGPVSGDGNDIIAELHSVTVNGITQTLLI